MNLKWFQEHKGATVAIFIGGAIVLYLLLRGSSGASSGGSSITGLAQTQAQLQAQESQTAAQEQAATIQAQASQNTAEIQANAGVQGNQDVIAGDIISEQLQNEAYTEGLQAEEETNNSLLPLEKTAINQVGKGGSLEASGVNELALLLGESNGLPSYNQISIAKANQPSTAVGILNGIGNIGESLFGSGLP